ncbi:unnamed protein product [Boreogadus saida]
MSDSVPSLTKPGGQGPGALLGLPKVVPGCAELKQLSFGLGRASGTPRTPAPGPAFAPGGPIQHLFTAAQRGHTRFSNAALVYARIPAPVGGSLWARSHGEASRAGMVEVTSSCPDSIKWNVSPTVIAS